MRGREILPVGGERGRGRGERTGQAYEAELIWVGHHQLAHLRAGLGRDGLQETDALPDARRHQAERLIGAARAEHIAEAGLEVDIDEATLRGRKGAVQMGRALGLADRLRVTPAGFFFKIGIIIIIIIIMRIRALSLPPSLSP